MYSLGVNLKNWSVWPLKNLVSFFFPESKVEGNKKRGQRFSYCEEVPDREHFLG